MIEKTGNIVIIGVGRMGLRHIEIAQAMGFNVVGLADKSPEALRNATATYKLDPNIEYTDTKIMFEKVKPNLVTISTTAPSHAELLLAAVDAGAKHILCEKPMSCSLSEADEMIKLCSDAGVVLAINHQMRFMPQYTHIKALIGSAEMGPVSSIIVAGSNFGLAMNGCHYFEMFRFITDSNVVGVQAWFDTEVTANPRGPQFEDRSGKLLAFGEKGQSIYLDFSGNAGHGIQTTFICRNGQVMVDELTGEVRSTSREEEYRDLPTSRYGMPAKIKLFEVAPADSVTPTLGIWKAMLAGLTFPDGATAGLHAVTCLVAAHESNSRGGVQVMLNDSSLPRDVKFPWA